MPHVHRERGCKAKKAGVICLARDHEHASFLAARDQPRESKASLACERLTTKERESKLSRCHRSVSGPTPSLNALAKTKINTRQPGHFSSALLHWPCARGEGCSTSNSVFPVRCTPFAYSRPIIPRPRRTGSRRTRPRAPPKQSPVQRPSAPTSEPSPHSLTALAISGPPLRRLVRPGTSLGRNSRGGNETPPGS